MKKIVAFLLIAMLVLSVSLTGCSGETYDFTYAVDLSGFDKVFIDYYFTEATIEPVFPYSYDTEKSILTIDFSDIAQTIYGDKYSSDEKLYEKFKKYAENIVNYLPSNKTAYPDEEFGFQMNEPKENEEIAIMHTNKGDIYIRFFPEAAPKAVENFKTHSKNGYYNGLTFHRVIKDFMIQGGDPNGTGTGGESIWGGSFEDEFDQKLLNIYGSLAMANSGVNTNGSQFFINQGTSQNKSTEKGNSFVDIYMYNVRGYENNLKYFEENGQADYFNKIFPTFDSFQSNSQNHQQKITYPYSTIPLTVPDKVWDLYKELGGNITLDGAWRASGGHTVFGHVFKGMDVVDSIADVATDSSTNKPKEDIIINSIEIVNYTK